MRHDVAEKLVHRHMPEKAYPEQWDIAELSVEAEEIFGQVLPFAGWASEEGIAQQEIIERLVREIDQAYAQKAALLGPERLRAVEKQVLLSVVNMRWREHLSLLDHLRSVIHLRGYAQRDPLNEYKGEAFALFEAMVAHLREAVTAQLMRVEVVQQQPEQPQQLPPMEAHHINPNTGEDEMALTATPMLGADASATAVVERNPKDPTTWGKVGRNEVCPCDSGKKYKHCHGRFA